MPEKRKTLIMKFGGGVLEGSESFHRIADLIISRQAFFERIVVVVSAMRGVTNRLIALAQSVNPNPPRREYDMLVSVGERVSISLLAMALERKGQEAVSFTGSQSGVITSDEHGQAQIVDVRPGRLLEALDRHKVAIVAGFQGVSLEKEITTLGRGGSDTTAVALGIALAAEKVEFYKDVPGVCTADPKHENSAQVCSQLNYAEALELVEKTGGRILHARALMLAQRNGLPLQVRPFWEDQKEGTVISESKIFQEMTYELSLSTPCSL